VRGPVRALSALLRLAWPGRDRGRRPSRAHPVPLPALPRRSSRSTAAPSGAAEARLAPPTPHRCAWITTGPCVGPTRRPPRASWSSADSATSRSCSGRDDEARAEFELLAAADFADLLRDLLWPHNLAFLAFTCSALGDARRAALLYGLLLPRASHNVLLSRVGGTAGSAAHYLGLLAAVRARWDEAVGHLERLPRCRHGVVAGPTAGPTAGLQHEGASPRAGALPACQASTGLTSECCRRRAAAGTSSARRPRSRRT
jgi:hypothetical protein